MLNTAEHHSNDPEENNIISGNKSVSRIKIFQIISFIRPAKSWERPQSWWEPCIQSIRILTHFFTAFRAYSLIFLCNYHFAAFVTVKCRDLMSPPKLSWDTPIFNIFKPVEINLIKTFRNKFCFTVFNCINSRFCKRFHFNKPLLWNSRFNSCSAAIACTYIMTVIFNFYQCSLSFKISHNCFPCLISVHSGILRIIIGNFCIICHNIYNRKVMAKSYFKVIRVMGRSDFNNTCTKIHFNIIISHNRNFPVNDRQNNSLSN